MPIVGFHIKKISAQRKNIRRGRIDINSTPKITSVKRSKVGLAKKEDSLNIEFEFVTEYKPNVGSIKFTGNVMYLGKDWKEGLKSWNDNKKLTKNIEIEVKNFLFRKCLSIGINLSEEMGLPPPLFFPRIMAKKKEEEKDLRYIG